MGIGETLQTKAGPLPVWAWGVGGGVGLALLLRLKGAGGANPVGPLTLQPASVGGGLSVAGGNGQGGGGDQGTGSGSLVDRTVVRDPTSYSVTQLWDTTDQGSVIGRYYNPNFPMFSRENRYGAGWDSQAQADAQGGSPSSPAPSPAQTAVVTVAPVSTAGGVVLPSYTAALDRLRSFVGWDAQSRVNSWVDGAINNAKQRGLWGSGNVTDANLRAIALGGVKWQQEEHGLADPTASGFDLSSFVSNTLNPQDAVSFLLAGGVPNHYALDYSRTSESGRPLTATIPVGV